jgi:hypothetical protein
MTEKAKDPIVAMRCPSPLVLFGIDNRGKPKGARFGKQHANLAIKAATQLRLNVLASDDPKVAEIAARLPVGRVHATGRTFVPFIRHDLYNKLLAAAADGNTHPISPPNGSSLAAASSPPGGSAPHLPQNWQQIGVGDLVVANENREDGWYEAIVVEANGDMLTLRWRDYPRVRRIVRHRLQLGLLYPSERRDWEINESLGPDKTRETGRSGPRSQPFAAQGLGRDRYQSPRVGQRRQPMGGVVGSHPGREGR